MTLQCDVCGDEAQISATRNTLNGHRVEVYCRDHFAQSIGVEAAARDKDLDDDDVLYTADEWATSVYELEIVGGNHANNGVIS